MKNPPEACSDKKDVSINYGEPQNFGLMQVKFKDNKTFDINSGWEPIETAEITQGIAAASNYVFSYGLQPRDKSPFSADKVV
jgi:hypothetical protein